MSMNKFICATIILFGLYSCEVEPYRYCYTFEVRYEESYMPYRPTYFSVARYNKCGLTEYDAFLESQSNEFYETRYDSINNYYITQRQSCSYWRSW